MSGTTISALPAAASVLDTDLLPVVEVGSPNVTKRGTAAQLRAGMLPITGGTLTGAVTAGAGVVLPNNVSLETQDKGGTARPALLTNTNNDTALVNSGGGSLLFANQAGTTQGSMSDAGAWSIGGTSFTVTPASTFVGAVTANTIAANGYTTSAGSVLGNGLQLANNQTVAAKDTGGTVRPLMSLGADNQTNLFNAGGNNWRILDQTGTTNLFVLDDLGNGAFAGNLNATGNLTIAGSSTFVNVTTTGFLNVGGNSNFTTLATSGNLTVGGQLLGAGGTVSTPSNIVSGAAIVANGSIPGSGSGSTLVVPGVQPNGPWGPAPIGVETPNGMSANGFFTTSDARLPKLDIADLSPDEAVDWVRASRPVTYTIDGKPGMGFIAQEEMACGHEMAVIPVPDKRPQFANTDGFAPAGYRLTLDYNMRIALHEAVIKALLERIEALEAEL